MHKKFLMTRVGLFLLLSVFLFSLTSAVLINNDKLPVKKTVTTGGSFSGTLDCSLITGGSDPDYCTDTGVGGGDGNNYLTSVSATNDSGRHLFTFTRDGLSNLYVSINDQDTDTDTFVGNYSTFLTHATTSYVDSQNTSQNNYIVSNNQSIINYILYVNSTNGAGSSSPEADPFWTANWTSYFNKSGYYQNATATFITGAVLNNGSYFNVAETDTLAYNGSLAHKSYVDSQDSSYNSSNNDYIAANNNSVTNWASSTFYLASNPSSFITSASLSPYALLSVLNNGSYFNPDLSGYATTTYVNTQNTSINNWANSVFATLASLNNYATMTFINSYFYNSSQVDAMNTSNNNWITTNNNSVTNYINSQDSSYNTSNNNYILANNDSVVNWATSTFTSSSAITQLYSFLNNYFYNITQADAQNTSNNNYIVSVNTSMKNYVDSAGGGPEADPYWTANWTNYYTKAEDNAMNTSNTNLINANNVSMNNKVNDQDVSFNLSNNNFINSNNESIINWANGRFYLDTNPSSYISNATMNKTVHCSNIIGSPDTDFCTDATSSAVVTDWYNVSVVATGALSNVAPYTNITGQQNILLANSFYNFDCFITFKSNNTGNGIRLAMNFTVAPAEFSGTVQIPIAADGAAGELQGWLSSRTDSVLGTGVQTVNTNYTARMFGYVDTGASATISNLQFAPELNLNQANVTRTDCQWKKR